MKVTWKRSTLSLESLIISHFSCICQYYIIANTAIILILTNTRTFSKQLEEMVLPIAYIHNKPATTKTFQVSMQQQEQ